MYFLKSNSDVLSRNMTARLNSLVGSILIITDDALGIKRNVLK